MSSQTKSSRCKLKERKKSNDALTTAIIHTANPALTDFIAREDKHLREKMVGLSPLGSIYFVQPEEADKYLEQDQKVSWLHSSLALFSK